MTGLRRLLVHQRWLAAWLIAAALAVRVLVPVGYMPGATRSLTLTICPDQTGAAVAAPMGGMDHHGEGERHDNHDPAGQPCPFVGLAMPSVAGAEQPVAVAPSATAPAEPVRAFADARAPPRFTFLQPPLRGPPSLG